MSASSKDTSAWPVVFDMKRYQFKCSPGYNKEPGPKTAKLYLETNRLCK